jgi:hypothetical protein
MLKQMKKYYSKLKISRILQSVAIVLISAFLLQCGSSPVVVPADIIDTTAGTLSGDAYPRITTVQPPDLTTLAPTNTNYIIVFSLPIDGVSLNTISITSSSIGPLTQGTHYTITPYAGNMSAIITFNPYGTGNASNPIPAGDIVIMTIGAGVTSSTQPLNNPGTYQFTVNPAGVPDTTLPAVALASRFPANGATNVPLNTTVSLNFTEAVSLDNSSINPGTFYLTGPSGIVPCTRTISGASPTWTVTLTPAENLISNATYTVNVTTGIKDISGNAISAATSWTFQAINIPYDPYGGVPSFQAGFPRVDSVESTGTSASISWDTNKPITSVLRFGRDNNNPPTSGTPISNTNYITSDTGIITGLTSGKQYYYRVDITDNQSATASSSMVPPLGIFITPTTETPVNVRATTGNQVIEYADERVRFVANSGALVIWSDYNGANYSLHGQLYNNTFAQQWGGTGADLFTEAGQDYHYISSAEDFQGEFIVLATRAGAGIYAKRISAAGAVVDWGTTSNAQSATDTGLQISATGTKAWAVPVYTGTITNVTSGTTTMSYLASPFRIYDPTVDFTSGSAVLTNDIVYNPATHQGTTVTTTNYRYILAQTANTIAAGNTYQIADGNSNFSSGLPSTNHTFLSTTTYNSGGTTAYTNHGYSFPSWFDSGDIIYNSATGNYGIITGSGTVYPTIADSTTDGTGAFQIIDTTNSPFTAVLGLGDLAYNVSSTTYTHISSYVSASTLNVATDIFTTGQNYRVFDNIDTGTGTAQIPNRMVKSVSASAAAGYMVYQTSTAPSPMWSNVAKVNSVISPTEVVLNINIFGTATQNYEMWSNTPIFSGTTPNTTTGYLVGSNGTDFSTLTAHDLIYNVTQSSCSRVRSPLSISTTNTPNDTVQLNNAATGVTSGDNYIIYHIVETGTANIIAPNRLYNAGASWSVGDVVENTSTSQYAFVTQVLPNEITLSTSIFNATSQGYKLYQRLLTSAAYSDYCTTHGLYTPFRYITTSWGINILGGNTFNLYNNRGHSSIAATLPANPLFANLADFSAAGVLNNDIILNITNPFGAPNPNYGIVQTKLNASALSLTNAVFADAENFNIIRYTFNFYVIDPTIIRTQGTATVGSGAGILLDSSHSGPNAFTSSTAAGDVVYDIATSQYALVSNVAASQLTLSPSITITSGDRYIVIRQRNVLFVWQDGVNIFFRVISYDKLGANTIPTNILAPTSMIAGTNPYAFSDEAGGSIIIYESGGVIYSQRVDGIGVLQGVPYPIDTSATTQTIVKAIPDGHGGAVVLYRKSGATTLAAQWIQNTAGVLSRQWTATGTAIAAIVTSNEDFAYNYNGGAPYIVVVWEQTNDIYTRRVGNGAWATLQITNNASIQTNSHIYLNGANTLITWDDRRWITLVGYGIYGIKINTATGAKDAAWTANSGGTADDNGIPLMMNKFNKNNTPYRVVSFNNGGSVRMIWEDTRDKNVNSVDILSMDISTITP